MSDAQDETTGAEPAQAARTGNDDHAASAPSVEPNSVPAEGQRAGGHDGEPPGTRLAQRVLVALEQQVLGQRSAAESLLVAYMAGGHALLEGVPGIGKTLLASTLGHALGLDFKRLQFTPDLMPADVIGTNVYAAERGGFHLVPGPVFTQVLMADEINRTPPKTQSALLEAMQERQVTIDGEGHPLDRTFFVIATQNPIEHEGTYPLPEAQLDRFLLRVSMGLPEAQAELELYRRAVAGELLSWGGKAPEPAVNAEEAWQLRQASRSVHVGEEMLSYLAELASALRSSAHVELAVSPRGALALLEASRAAAVLEGRSFVIPDDFKRHLEACWGHRLLLTAEAELEGHSPHSLISKVAAEVEVPK